MKTLSRLLIVLCVAVLGGCYIDPAVSGSYAVDVGVGTRYYDAYPYYWGPPPYRGYYWDDAWDWRYRGYYRPFPYRTRPPYYGREP